MKGTTMPSTTSNQNPTHPNALKEPDLTAGRQILICEEGAGFTPATIEQGPHQGYHSGSAPLYPGEPTTVVVLVSYEHGGSGSCGLVEIGVCPDASGQWTEGAYVLAAS